MNIKHVFFDLDHTLWDFDKNSELCFQQIFKEQSIRLDFNLFLKTYIPINFNYWKLFREEKISKEKLRYGRLKDTFDTLNYQISDVVIDKVSEDYISYLSNYNNLISGAIELLEYLNKKYQLHIITNGFKEVQHLKLQKSGLMKYFNTVVTSECVGVKKPNAKIFEFALTKSNAQPVDSIMIGDSYEADVLGALNAGILPVYLNLKEDKDSGKKGIITINSLLALKQYL